MSTPAGILTLSERSRSTRPWPRQLLQGSVTVRPSPPHCGQVRATVKKPCVKRTWPWPSQVRQGAGWEPLALPEPLQSPQLSSRGMRSVVSVPKAASSKVRVRS